MQFVARLVSPESEKVKSIGSEVEMRSFIESYWLDEKIGDDSWRKLLMGEKLAFFGDRTIEVDLQS